MARTNRFSPDGFTPTRFSTQADKAKFAEQFVRFVLEDFEWSHFPEWFYKRLSNTFGHIAHTNRLGFFETFFRTISGKVRFLRCCLQWPRYGDAGQTWSDVEQAIQVWLMENNVLSSYMLMERSEQELRERALLVALLEKYPEVRL